MFIDRLNPLETMCWDRFFGHEDAGPHSLFWPYVEGPKESPIKNVTETKPETALGELHRGVAGIVAREARRAIPVIEQEYRDGKIDRELRDIWVWTLERWVDDADGEGREATKPSAPIVQPGMK